MQIVVKFKKLKDHKHSVRFEATTTDPAIRDIYISRTAVPEVGTWQGCTIVLSQNNSSE